MKVAIITIHAMHNPGSVFQAFALQQFLRKYFDTDVIDYRPSYFYSERSKLKLLLKKLMYGKAYHNREIKFSSFIRDNMVLTRKYTSFDALKNAALNYDVYIAGSDQLWNSDFPCGNDDAFYLKFTQGKKISYSTSVGKTIIDEKNLQILQEKLVDFKHLAVREKKTAEDLSSLLHREVKWVCDPVFLLEPSCYMKFMNETSPLNEPYAVVYLCPESELLNRIVEYYATIKGLRIVLVGGFTKRCQCDLHIKDVGPSDFLNLIYHADVVISKSFHATAFCHIFHKEFITLIPPKNGERILSLLELTNLSHRGIIDKFDADKVSIPINWDYVDHKLEEYVAESKQYLINAIEA